MTELIDDTDSSNSPKIKQRPRRAFGEARARSDRSVPRRLATPEMPESQTARPSSAMDKTIIDYDFAHVPIIVTDWDADRSTNKPRATSAPALTLTPASPTSETNRSVASSLSSAATGQAQQLTTGFADVAGALWSRMTGSMRQKLREACVEVLRRTDDEAEGRERRDVDWRFGGEGREWDEDARFLD